MTTVDILNVAFGLLVGGLLLAGGAIGVQALGQARHEAAIFQALESWRLKAIFAGEYLALEAMQQAEIALGAADRRAIAESLYDLLPDVLMVAGKPVPIGLVRRLVPRERFEALIKETYDAVQGFIVRHEAYLRAQVENL